MIREQIWWYFARSAGLLTWLAASGSILLGLVMSSRRVGRRTNGPWLLDFHRFLSGLTITFMVLHMVALWADSFVTFGWAELLVPGASEWRPLPVALGVLAFWILLGVEVSSLLKNKIPHRWWHMLHLGSYLVAVLGTAHALTAGSDVGNPFVRAIGIVVVTTIIGLTAMRVVEAKAAFATTTDPTADRLAAAKRVQADEASHKPPSAPTGPAPAPIPVVPVRRMPIPTAPPAPAPARPSPERAAQAATRSR